MILGFLYRTYPQSLVIVRAFDMYLNIFISVSYNFIVIVRRQIVSQSALTRLRNDLTVYDNDSFLYDTLTTMCKYISKAFMFDSALARNMIDIRI